MPQANPINTFIGYAKGLGMDPDAFGACLNSDKHADVVTANLRLAQQFGLSGTPTIMVGLDKGMPRRLGDDFSLQGGDGVVDQVLAEAAAQDSARSAEAEPP